jgi:hypothetical protein
MRRLVAGLFACSCVVGCFVDVPDIDEPNVFACETDGDCASGYSCGANKRCVKPGSDTNPCLPNPCTGVKACVPDATSGFQCIDDCRTSGAVCVPGAACMIKTASGVAGCVLECGAGKTAGVACSVENSGQTKPGFCVDAYLATENHVSTRLVCAPCDPVANPGGCSGTDTCDDKPGKNDYFSSLQCVGASCVDDDDCNAELTNTKCDANLGNCVNPCASSPFPCATTDPLLGCRPTTTGARYECGACDGTTAGPECDTDRVCVTDTLSNVCVRRCATTSDCPTPGTDAAVCVPVQDQQGNVINLCAYCPGGCGARACITNPSPSDYWSGWAICEAPLCGTAACGVGQICLKTAAGSDECHDGCSVEGAACGAAGRCTKVHTSPSGFGLGCVMAVCSTPACPTSSDVECAIRPAPANGFVTTDAAASASFCQCTPTPTGWYAVGLSSCGDGVAPASVFSHSLAGLASSLRPIAAAYQDNTAPAGILVRAWNRATASWDWLGTSSGVRRTPPPSLNNYAQYPMLTADSSRYLLTWSEFDAVGLYNIYAAQPDSALTSWVDMGGSSLTAPGLSRGTTTYAVLPVLTPQSPSYGAVAVWLKGPGSSTGTVQASHLVGSTWTLWPDISPGETTAEKATVAGTVNGLFAAYQFNSLVKAKKLDGSSWVDVISSSQLPSTGLTGPANGITMTVEGSTPVVVMSIKPATGAANERVVIRKPGTAVWEDYSLDNFLGAYRTGGDVAVATSNAGLLVAWSAGATGDSDYHEVFVARYDSATNKFVGWGGSMQVSTSSSQGSTYPKLWVMSESPLGSPGETVCVSWMEQVSGFGNGIYLRCHAL